MGQGSWDDPRARATRGLRRPSLDARSRDHPSHPLKRDSLLRPCLGQGASRGEEAVSVDSGRVGDISARVGRVRCVASLSILLGWPPVILQTSKLSIWRKQKQSRSILLGIGDNVRIGFLYPSNLVDLCDHHIGKGSLIGNTDEENNVGPSKAGVRLFDAGKALDGLQHIFCLS